MKYNRITAIIFTISFGLLVSIGLFIFSENQLNAQKTQISSLQKTISENNKQIDGLVKTNANQNNQIKELVNKPTPTPIIQVRYKTYSQGDGNTMTPNTNEEAWINATPGQRPAGM